MSARFEICVATPFGPHVIDTADTQRDADYRRMVAAEHQEARVFTREVKSPHPLLDQYTEAAAAWEAQKERVTRKREELDAELLLLDELGNQCWNRNDDRHAAFVSYREACEAENLEPHTFDQWTIHGEPEGPLG